MHKDVIIDYNGQPTTTTASNNTSTIEFVITFRVVLILFIAIKVIWIKSFFSLLGLITFLLLTSLLLSVKSTPQIHVNDCCYSYQG